MGITQMDGRAEGWLYLIRSSRIGLQYSRRRYFVLEDHLFKSYKSIPTSNSQDPVKSAIIDSCIRVTDNGRESIQRKVLFIFTLYNTSNHNDQLKLGASSPEEAARWIHCFQEAALKTCPNVGDNIAGCPKGMWQPFRLNGSSRVHHSSCTDWTLYSSTHVDPTRSDVVAPSSWNIFSCQNGLRLFREAKDKDAHWKGWDDHPAIMAVGVIDGASEDIFRTLMSLGPSRSEWDFCFCKGSVVEHLDGHTEIIHKQLNRDWLPWGMKRRDLLLRRYWRREDDGTYVILYHSVYHKKCPRQRGYVRACLKSGGYVISPVSQGKQSVVKHMLAIDWRYWKAYLLPSSAHSITIHMLGRVAALRELFKAKVGNLLTSELASGDLVRGSWLLHCKEEDNTCNVQRQRVTESKKLEKEIPSSEVSSLVELNDASDEFFDVPEPSDSDLLEESWLSDCGSETYSQLRKLIALHSGSLGNILSTCTRHRCVYISTLDLALSGITLDRVVEVFLCGPTARICRNAEEDMLCRVKASASMSWISHDLHELIALLLGSLQETRNPKFSGAAGFVKKLHDLAEVLLPVQKKGYVDLQEMGGEGCTPCCYGATLPRDPSCGLASSCSEADPLTFLIRGKTYLEDQIKIKANKTLMQMVAADWLKSDKREDDLAGRPGGIVQKYASRGAPEFFFIVNIQVPGSTTYSLALYYMMSTPLEEVPLLERFVNEDDAYRNGRFKLIPYIPKGSWIVKQSVGKKACLIGQALEINYFRGSNYIELGVDIGSSTVARGVVSLVLGYLNNLVIEMAFLVQANTHEELPEQLLGTCRLNHLDASKAVWVTP